MVETIQEIQIFKWIDTFLQNTEIVNYELNLKFSEKGEGYTTTVIFVTVNGNGKSTGENTKLDLVLKVSKLFKTEDQDVIHEMFKKEAFVYDKVFPQMKIFAHEKRGTEFFNSVPMYYTTIRADGREILVLDNLRTKGYKLHDRIHPMNFHHIKLVLKKYAQFHAISFAFKDQKPDEFKRLFGNYVNCYKILASSVFGEICQHKMKKAFDTIYEVNKELAKKFDKILQKGVINIWNQIAEETEESVITHGDCWNSNFLFKYDVSKIIYPTITF